jgi:hypothetical protein
MRILKFISRGKDTKKEIIYYIVKQNMYDLLLFKMYLVLINDTVTIFKKKIFLGVSSIVTLEQNLKS